MGDHRARARDDLLQSAREAQARAYAPYSRFRVGAALLADDGRVFLGCNVENASYGLTVCAERVALGAAVVAGARGFSKLVIASDSTPPASPCGACRQALSEFGTDLHIESVGPSEGRDWMLRDLIPDPFGSVGD